MAEEDELVPPAEVPEIDPADEQEPPLRFNQAEIEAIAGLVSNIIKDDLPSFSDINRLVDDAVGGLEITGPGVSGGDGNWVIQPTETFREPDIIINEVPPFIPGFRVSFDAEAGEATVRWAAVTGLNASGYVPVVTGGTALDADTTPVTSASAGDYIYLGVEITPATELIPNTTVYRMKDSGYTIVNDRVVVTTNASNTQLPAFDSSTGAVTQNGIYAVPLARITSDNRVKQLTLGPQAWTFCSSGMLTVMAPVIVHTGDLVQLS